MTNYRKLTSAEISRLIEQHCTAEDWNRIEVAPEFSPDRIAHVHFSGQTRLGIFIDDFTLPGGVRKPSGIYHATLHNCTVGNNTLIEGIANYIANYHIGDRCFLQNINLLLTEGESTFGNGVEVSVLNETGGREVPIYNRLSAQLAYLIALYRHRPQFIARLQQLIARYTQAQQSDQGTIGNDSYIVNCGTIRQVNIGERCRIEGTSRLARGTINSNTSAPVYIGANVSAEDFIISSGAHLSEGVVLSHCFVGQACRLTRLFSAHDSLFFSNCHGENGETCAIFAGPYTVTMHKSSLLIAGYFSFLNAGSGSNQSNHMYKLGPIHQGIVERGSKTTSDSYLLFPAHIGAFSLIMGRHVSHPDTSALPFSYLIEHNGHSLLLPGANLKSVGTIRDAQKWPKRDLRTDPDHLDCINFNLLSPYTIQRMMQGINILHQLLDSAGENAEFYTYHNTIIKPHSLRKGIELYTLAIDKFMGNSIIHRLGKAPFANPADMCQRLQPTDPQGAGEWVDLAGLILPQQPLHEAMNRWSDNEATTLTEMEQFFRDMHRRYYDMEWTWVSTQIPRWYRVDLDHITPKAIIAIVQQWNRAVVTLDRMLLDDSHKEFAETSRIGFGIDATRPQRNLDFEQVRGNFEQDPFVKMVEQHIIDKTALGNELIKRLKEIGG